jgi:peptide deformylase
MSILTILQLKKNDFSKKETPLKVPSNPVTDFGESFQKIVDDLIETLKYHKIAIGLSAPQVGIPLRLSVINLNPEKAEPTLIIVNPEISSNGGKKDKKKESCMSLPHFRGEVERKHKLNIRYQNRLGEYEKLEVEGFLARVICHEIDHLEGILYVDRMKSLAELEPVEFFK